MELGEHLEQEELVPPRQHPPWSNLHFPGETICSTILKIIHFKIIIFVHTVFSVAIFYLFLREITKC